jgi:hypothetical protein
MLDMTSVTAKDAIGGHSTIETDGAFIPNKSEKKGQQRKIAVAGLEVTDHLGRTLMASCCSNRYLSRPYRLTKTPYLSRILEKQNRLQKSQVSPFSCTDDQMGLAFQGFYKRDRETDKVTDFPQQLFMHAQIKKPNEACCARGIALALTLNKFLVPQKRGRFTKSTLLPTYHVILRSRWSEGRPR